MEQYVNALALLFFVPLALVAASIIRHKARQAKSRTELVPVKAED